MSKINFQATLFKNQNSDILLRLPKEASEQLPSKGMALVEGTINNSPIKVVLEPDNEGSHWFKLEESVLESANLKVGDEVSLQIEPTKDWPEPKVSFDLQKILQSDSEVEKIWKDITPMARWDWIRWIGAAKQEETRQKRAESVPSRLKSGKRRPCCFDRSQCTLTEV